MMRPTHSDKGPHGRWSGQNQRELQSCKKDKVMQYKLIIKNKMKNLLYKKKKKRRVQINAWSSLV